MEVLETCKPSATRAETTTGAQPEIARTVKWYDPERGSASSPPITGENDVFVHATTLARPGIATLAEGQEVFVECRPGKKGWRSAAFACFSSALMALVRSGLHNRCRPWRGLSKLEPIAGW
nr:MULTISPECIES: cold shock domain-containing protein [unclassified Mesorhizobium]